MGVNKFFRFISDEPSDSEYIDKLLENLSKKAFDMSEKSYIKPNNFLGVSAQKLFRDDIYGHLRFPFIADHKYFKKK